MPPSSLEVRSLNFLVGCMYKTLTNRIDFQGRNTRARAALRRRFRQTGIRAKSGGERMLKCRDECVRDFDRPLEKTLPTSVSQRFLRVANCGSQTEMPR